MNTQLAAWVERYVRAWNSNDPEEIMALFTPDAAYYTAPYATPWQGREEIRRQWLANKDEPGEASFTWQVLVDTPAIALVQGHTTYRTPPTTYSNIWVIRLDIQGRCQEFIEWWMKHPASEAE
jgi:uncharacterized protein (TIGR02246 family)